MNSVNNFAHNDTMLVNSYLGISKYYLSVNLDSFTKYVDKAERISLKGNNHRLARIYDAKGLKYMFKSKLDSAEFYFKKAIELSNDNLNPIETSTIYSNYSTMFQKKGDLSKAVEYLEKGINLVKNNEAEVCLLYYNLASYYMDLALPNEAEKYLKLSYKNASKSGDMRVEGYALAGLGHFYNTNQKKDSAEFYLKKGLKICVKSSNPQICHVVNSMLSELYLEKKDYKSAKVYAINTRKYAKMRNAQDDLLRSYMYLGRVEGFLGNYNSSVKYYKNFEQLYDSIHAGNIGMNEFRYWADFEIEKRNFKESTRLLKKYINIKDSAVAIENRELLADLNKKFESEQKDNELSQQSLKLEQQETELQKKRIQYSYMTGAALVLLVGSTLLWFLYQQRQKRKNQEIITLKREQQVQTLESLMEGEEKERMRIAKELHDGVNVDLSAIKYKLTSLLEKNNVVINEAVAMIDKSCEQVRAISHNLVPPALKDFTLLEALHDYCSKTNAIYKIEVSFQPFGDPITLPKKTEANIFRIVQELVNNSVKHAEATEIDVQISYQNETIELTIEDNGKGYDVNATNGNGIGLQNVQSRIAYLNATLDTTSDSNGTSYVIYIDTKTIS